MQRGVCCRVIKNTFLSLKQAYIPRQVIRQRVIQQQVRTFCRAVINMSYSLIERGSPNTLDHRIYIAGENGNIVSPFHDIPTFADQEKKIVNMVVEIPRWTNHKMEVCKEEKLNPIKQDIKKGNLRFVKNIFPHHGYIWNYGAIPQTWEDPNYTDPETNTKGDKDPLDICEIGQTVHKRGAVIQVKVLGTMCLIDEGETDWKIIGIDVTDPLASKLHDIEDVDKHMPGFLRATYEWFRLYKVPDGKPENEFAFNGLPKNEKFAMEVIDLSINQWKKLIGQEVENEGIACENTSVAGSPYLITQDKAKIEVEANPPFGDTAQVPEDVNKWYYVNKL